MFAELQGNELHLFGEPAAFNAIARSIHKGKHGASASFPLVACRSPFISLITKCSGQLGAIQVHGQEIHISYSEGIKNRLYPFFSMPAETQPGSLFFISPSQQESPPILDLTSLNVSIHIIARAV